MVGRDTIFKEAAPRLRETAARQADEDPDAVLAREVSALKADVSRRAWEVQRAVVPEPPRGFFATRWATLEEREVEGLGPAKLIARLHFGKELELRTRAVYPHDVTGVIVPGEERFDSVEVMVAPTTEENDAIIDSPDVLDIRDLMDKKGKPVGGVVAYAYSYRWGVSNPYEPAIESKMPPLQGQKEHLAVVASFIEQYATALDV